MAWLSVLSLLGGLTLAQGLVARESLTEDARVLADAPSVVAPTVSDPSLSASDIWDLGVIETSPYDLSLDISAAREAPPPSSKPDAVPDAIGVATSIAPDATIQIPPPLRDRTPHTAGTLYTDLDITGRATRPPLLAPILSTPTSILQPSGTMPSIVTPTGQRATTASADIFAEPIDTKAPPSSISVRDDHPVPRKGIQTRAPLQTNKFYSNFFLGDQLGPTYTFPYSLQWSGGRGATSSWGLSCSHVEKYQRVYGQEKFNGAASYYLNPVGIQSMVISAAELGNDTKLSVDSITAFSARVSLAKDSESPPAVSFPIVQGMAYVTATFDGAVPLLQTGVYFRTMSRITRDPKEHVAKYTFNLEDGTTWRVYAWRTKGDDLDLDVINNGLARSKKPFHGVIQVCKDPKTPGSEGLLDDGAGIYPVTLGLSGSVDGSAGSYSFKFRKDGHQSGSLYMYALPHHVDSFDNATRQRVQKVQMQSTTKGLATLVQGTEWTMVEPRMPVDMGFGPWHPDKGSLDKLSDNAKSAIRAAAAKEASQNMIEQSNLDSMYFSGKVWARRRSCRTRAD